MFVASTLFKRRTSRVPNLMLMWDINCFSLAVYLQSLCVFSQTSTQSLLVFALWKDFKEFSFLPKHLCGHKHLPSYCQQAEGINWVTTVCDSGFKRWENREIRISNINIVIIVIFNIIQFTIPAKSRKSEISIKYSPLYLSRKALWGRWILAS